MRFAALALFAVLGLAASYADTAPAPKPADPQAAWKADLDDTNKAYAKVPTAILKIDDALYLKPGETAWLVRNDDGSYKWHLKSDKPALPHVAFAADSKTALYSADDKAAPIDLLTQKDPTTLSPTIRLNAGMAQIEPGKMGLRVAVYNDANPKAAAFTGVDYFPYDPSYVIAATFEPKAKLEPKTFQTSRGWYKQFYYAGDAVFTLQGQTIRLPMYTSTDHLAENDSLAAFIMDATTGKETYGVGRYVDVDVPKGPLPTSIKIDFNYLYNPNCARSSNYNCPVAVDHVPVAIHAGEKKPVGHA